jgi:peptidoglycan/LPS O-acetylase OafA/YrhL
MMPAAYEPLPNAAHSRALRLAYLETLRGCAAFAVMFGHILGAMKLQGFAVTAVLTLLDTPLAILVNGRGAVVFFFVLSGYVLALRAIETSDTRLVARGALKRWPRLAGPVLVTTLMSCALWNLDLYSHAEVGKIVGSDWLTHFAYGSLDLNALPDTDWAAAIIQGTVTSFIAGDSSFNPNLWTMQYEFLGSFAVFFAAYLIIRYQSVVTRGAVLLAIFGILATHSLLYLPFGAGLALATLHSSGRTGLPADLARFMVFAGLYILGFREGSSSYPFLAGVSPVSDTMTLGFTVASVALIAGLTAWPVARDALSGQFGRMLGALSFAVYLVHIPILMAAGCGAFLLFYPDCGGNAASLALACATMGGTLLAALAITAADVWWLAFLDRAVTAMMKMGGPRAVQPGLAPVPTRGDA